MIGLPYGEKNYDNMSSRFHLIPERYGQTDGQTDRIAISISRVTVLTRDKKRCLRGQKWSTRAPFLTPHWRPLKISPSKGKTLCPDDRSIVTQTFTRIGVTVAEISVTEQIHRQNYSILVSDKSHTGVAFVDNKW